MITLVIDQYNDTSWIACEFCGRRDYPHATRMVTEEQSRPTPEAIILAHFVLDSDESYDFAPCSDPPKVGYRTVWEARVEDGKPFARGSVTFLVDATVPQVERDSLDSG